MKLNVPYGVQIQVQEKAWVDASLALDWVRSIWLARFGYSRTLLTMDTFSAHHVEEVKKELKMYNTKIGWIPGGCTSRVQPLDVSINHPFKDRLRILWTQWMQEQIAKEIPLKKPSKQQVVDWALQAWEAIPPDMIRHSFLCTSITNKLNGSEDELNTAQV